MSQSPTSGYGLRPVISDDYSAVKKFIDQEEHVLHRHLDWHTALEWIGTNPFWVLDKGGEILAALACPPDPPGLAWVRLFAIAPQLRAYQTWELLFNKVLEEFGERPPSPIISLALKKPYLDILIANGFSLYQQIIVLERNGKTFPFINPTGFSIRPMNRDDLVKIEILDRAAFEPLWHNSYRILSKAFEQSAYATVIELGGEIVAYQISTIALFTAHLARIAVQPGIQKNGFASYLLCDLIDHFSHRGIDRITLNTQSNNEASLALYRKAGFFLTQEKFPVYIYNCYKKGKDYYE